MHQSTVILASTSRYKAASFKQLKLSFEQIDPGVDETPLDGETADLLAQRLAQAKARAVAAHFPDSVVIGADQVGQCAGRLLHKPDSQAAAVTQLLSLRKQPVVFYTAVAMMQGERLAGELVRTDMLCRDFSEAQAAAYVQTDESWDCAGSFKVESLGIALFSEIRSSDPTAIIGLPLISVVSLLNQFGVSVLA